VRLVADSSVLVAEALRARGRDLLEDPLLELVTAAEAQSEAEHELSKRVAIITRRTTLIPDMAEALLRASIDLIRSNVAVAPSAGYQAKREEARQRMRRDPDDAPTLALALVLDCGIWTSDYDFFGCGMPIWSTETLLWYLGVEAQQRGTQ